MAKYDKYVVLNDNTLVQKNPKQEQVSVSGLYIAEAEGVEKYIASGIVLKVGPGKLAADGITRNPLTVQVGQTVWFNTKGAVRFLPSITEEYFVVMEKDFYCLEAEPVNEE
jgi:co-chaperonin GroES (HSP10)